MQPPQRADKGAIMRRGRERRARFKDLRRGRSCCEAAGERGVLLSCFWYRWHIRLPPFPEPVYSSCDAACDSQLHFALLNNLKWHHFQQVRVHLRHVDFLSPEAWSVCHFLEPAPPHLRTLHLYCVIRPQLVVVGFWKTGQSQSLTKLYTPGNPLNYQLNYQKSFFFFAQEKNKMGSIVCMANRLYALSYWPPNQLSKLQDYRLDPRGRTAQLTRLIKVLDEELMMKQ